MVRLVHHDDGVRPREGRNQRRIVGALDVVRLPGAALVVGQLHERRVLGEGAPPVLVLEGVVGQHEHGELVLHRRAREPAPAQAVLLVKHLHPVGEVAVQSHAQRIRRVAQLPQGLLQYLLARHEPHHDVGRPLGKLFAYHVNGVGGDERLAAAGGHLHANLGRAAQVVGVAGDAVRAGHQPVVGQVPVVSGRGVPAAGKATQVGAQVCQYLALIALEFHVPTSSQSGAVSA